MLLCAFPEGRRRSTPPTHKRPRSSNTARDLWLVFQGSSRSGRRTNCRRWSRPRDVCPPYPARVRRLRGFVCAICVCDGEPSVVLDLCVITRERQVLSSNRCVVSGRARKCRDGTREGAASRVRAAVRKLSYVTRVGSARVCRSDGVLQVGVSCSPCVAAAVMQQQRSLTSNATQIK